MHRRQTNCLLYTIISSSCLSIDDVSRLTTKLCNSYLVLISVALHGVRPIRTKPMLSSTGYLSLGKYPIIDHINCSFVISLLISLGRGKKLSCINDILSCTRAYKMNFQNARSASRSAS